MKLKNFTVLRTVYFEDDDDNIPYLRATSLDDVERRYGESWETEYNPCFSEDEKKEILKHLKP